MKLTNEQTNVLVATFKEKLEEKKNKIRESEEYKNLLNTLKSKHSLPIILELMREEEEINLEIENLQNSRKELREKMIEECEANDYGFTPNNIKSYGLSNKNPEKVLVHRLEATLFSDFPTDNEIKSAVILETIAGKSDIFKILEDKFLKE